jgi:hypothetical protein
VRYPSVRREKRVAAPRVLEDYPLFAEGPQLMPPPVQQSFPFERLIAGISDKLDRIHSTQLALCAQVKDVRVNLPVQRRPLSRWDQQIHIEVLNSKRGGLCPACESVRVCDENGRRPGAEYDHWFSRHRNRAEESWLVCEECNRRLNNTEFKSSVRSAFESYQLALGRVLQERQSKLA